MVQGYGTFTTGGVTHTEKLIYDTELDITWLDFTRPQNTWDNQMAWATTLMVTFAGQTFDSWRLPQTLPVNGSTYDYEWSDTGSTDRGWNVSAPGSAYPESTASEMAHLYYNSLGNLGKYDVGGYSQGIQPDYGLKNTGPFDNLQPHYYWSETDYGLIPTNNYAWDFNFGTGNQDYDGKTYANGDDMAMVVFPGNVAAPIPEPSTLLLLDSASLLALGLRRRLKK